LTELMTYDEALDYLGGLTKFGIRFGLERITALTRHFGNPQDRLRVIHVGGTNGKGSTCTFISSILRAADYRVGLYLSPYVNDLRERIQVDGQMISREAFAGIISEIRPVADEISRSEMGPVTEFEVKTLAALLHFSRQQVDFAVLEVGMGGRFDATNIVHPLVAVITNIGLDHTERLGRTHKKIAFEKAGIVKTGSVLVTAVDHPGAWKVILDRAHEEGCEVWRLVDSGVQPPAGPSADVHLRFSSISGEFVLGVQDRTFGPFRPGLRGAFQHKNAALALAAIEALARYEVRIPARAISEGIESARIPGRLEVLAERPLLVIDGAHNAEAAAVLAEAVPASFEYENLILVIGMLASHSAQGVLNSLAPLASKIIATQPPWMKATPAEEMAEAAAEYCGDVETAPTVPAAVERALACAGQRDLVLVTGSFYTIGAVPRTILRGQ